MNKQTSNPKSKIESIACIGECMVEFSSVNNAGQNDLTPYYQKKFAGDTFNTAYYLRKHLPQEVDVSYVTAIGSDKMSEAFTSFVESFEIKTELIQTLTNATLGLYLIENDTVGERFFHYWRGQSAAKQLFNAPHGDKVLAHLNHFDAIYLSGITLAILENEGLEAFANFLIHYQGTCYFDPNYRPTLWPSSEEASITMQRVVPKGATIFTTLEDEQKLHGLSNSQDIIEKWRAFGAKDIIVKQGARACHAFINETFYQVEAQSEVVVLDTTGAGHSFNSAYIASRIIELGVEESIQSAHSLASKVIQTRGALI